MKSTMKHVFPPGWNERKVKAVIAHYNRQTDEEAAMEIETAPEAPGETWMCVPTELVTVINDLIKVFEKRNRPGGTKKNGTKTQRG